MMPYAKKLGILLASIILFLACTIRSDFLIDKSFLPRFLVISSFFLIIIVFGVVKLKIKELSIYGIVFLLFYILNLISTLWSLSIAEAFMQAQIVLISFIVLCYAFTLILRSSSIELIFSKIILAVLFFSFFLAFYQMVILEYFDPYKVHSISSNNNLYSGFLLLALPVIIIGYAHVHGCLKIAFVAAGILSFFYIIILQSRAVYFGLIVSLVLLFIIAVIRYRKLFVMNHIRPLVGSIVVLAILVSAFYTSLDQIRKDYFKNKVAIWQYFSTNISDNNAKELINNPNSETNKSLDKVAAFDLSSEYYQNANLRLIFWGKTVGLIKQKPFIGIGAGNWKTNIASIKEPENPEHTLKNYTYSYPHNEWLGIVSELGIIGLILSLFVFLYPLFLVMQKLFANRTKPKFTEIIYTAFITGFYVYACFDFPLKRVEHIVLLFSILGFLYGMQAKPQININLQSKIPVKVFTIIFSIALAFSLLLAIFRVNGEYYTLKMFRNERIHDKKVIAYCKSADNCFYQLTPNSLPLAWFEGVAHFRMGNINDAYYCFDKAIELTPYEVRVINDYAACLYQLHNSNEAKNQLFKALEIDPFFDEARFNLAAIYFHENNLDSASIVIAKCSDSKKKLDYLSEINSAK